MLNNAHGFASFSTDDLDKAAIFYGDTLGLAVKPSEYMLKLKLNGTTVMVYSKDDHKPATFTVLNFAVDDLEKTMDELRDKGIKFEIYNGEGGVTTDEKGVSTWDEEKGAWFKDPAGNIIGLFEGGEPV